MAIITDRDKIFHSYGNYRFIQNNINNFISLMYDIFFFTNDMKVYTHNSSESGWGKVDG